MGIENSFLNPSEKKEDVELMLQWLEGQGVKVSDKTIDNFDKELEIIQNTTLGDLEKNPIFFENIKADDIFESTWDCDTEDCDKDHVNYYRFEDDRWIELKLKN